MGKVGDSGWKPGCYPIVLCRSTTVVILYARRQSLNMCTVTNCVVIFVYVSCRFLMGSLQLWLLFLYHHVVCTTVILECMHVYSSE